MEQQIQHELTCLLRQLCRIPAPTGQEDARAAFCQNWLQAAGYEDCIVDEAKNVICPVGVTADNDVVIFMAHMDTVFPDTEPMELREADGRLYCPGAGDDTANLAVLLMAAKLLRKSGRQPKTGVVFCANSCEEGLGNLKGCRALMARYAGRVRQVVSFDLGLDAVFTRAVGSARYRITMHAPGGHSYLDFGKPNAIAEMAKLIGQLYALPLPADTTCNVGQITGGTSVNTIAQRCEILYEYRAESNESLERMAQQLNAVLTPYGAAVECELLGLRPGMGICHDPAAQEALLERIDGAVQRVTGVYPRHIAGSTDCNIPFSQGIPAACVGLVNMEGAHTRQEFVELDSLSQGLAVALDLLSDYFT